MSTVPPQRRPARSDPDLRAIGLLALAMMLAAAIAGMVWARVNGRGPAPRGGEMIGATFAPLESDAVVIDSVRADGAARRGGLLVGDVIEAVGDVPVPTVDAADRAFLNPDLDIRVRRGNREINLHLDATGDDARGQQDPADRG